MFSKQLILKGSDLGKLTQTGFMLSGLLVYARGKLQTSETF